MRPFHDIRYTWNFGDVVSGPASPCGSSINAGEGFWACGSSFGQRSKNIAEGPEAAHVYETAGIFQACLTGQDAAGTASPLCQTITVADATGSAWAGSNTVCFSGVGNFVGCPSGSLQITVGGDFCTAFNANKAAGRRYLLDRGEVYSATSSCNINVNGPSLIGAYGTGAKPILNAPAAVTILAFSSYDGTHMTTDWRLQDLDLRANAVGTFAIAGKMASTVLIDRLNFSAMNKNLAFPSTILAAGESISDHFVVQDSISNGLFTPCTSSGEVAFLAEIEAAHFQGLYIDNKNLGEHGIRNHWMRKGSITNTTVKGICGGKVPITVRGTVDGQTGYPSGPLYNEQIVVADNYVIGSAGSGTISFGPQNNASTEKGRDMIIERNYVDASAGSGQIDLWMTDVTVRDNLLNTTGNAVGVSYGNLTKTLPIPTNINVYSNSLYSTATGGGNSFFYFQSDYGSGFYAGAVFNFKNNIWFCPSCGGGQFYQDPYGTATGAIIGSTNNTAFSQNPLFATTPPTNPAAFKPLSGSPVIGAGIAIAGIFDDFFDVTTPATPDIGAVLH